MKTKPYRDGRPAAHMRMNATDQGVIFEHGKGPDNCDGHGAREASVVYHEGLFHLFYDGANPEVGWLACLATSTDLKNWERHGPVLGLGDSAAPDSHTATSPWFWHEDGLWHMYYLGSRQCGPPPDRVPEPPYLTCKAESHSLRGPWKKRYDVVPVTNEPGTCYADTACPGCLFRYQDRLHMYFSTAVGHYDEDGVFQLQRGLGLLGAPGPDGPWRVDNAEMLPVQEQIENSSVYYEKENDTWFLFTNHIGINATGMNCTDAVWVYWSNDPRTFDPNHKAIVIDGQNCTWSDWNIGMPSVVPVDGRLAVFYDSAGGTDPSHVDRDIGLAWLDLPLTPPVG